MNPENNPRTSAEDAQMDELQSPQSPARSDRSNTYSPSADHYGNAPTQNNGADTVMGGQSDIQSPLSPVDPTYSPAASYSAAYTQPPTQYSPAASTARGRDELQQSPQSPVQHDVYSPVATYSAGPAQYSPASPAQYSPASPVQSPPLYSQPNQYSRNQSPGSPASTEMSNFMRMSPTAYPAHVYSPDARFNGNGGYSDQASSSNVNRRPETSQGSNSPPYHSGPDPISASARYQRPAPLENSYAAVRATHGPPRSPLGPIGPGSAVSASGFQGYELPDPSDRDWHRLAAVPIRQDSPPEIRHNVEYSVSPPVAPIAQLPPGTDPPPLVSQGISWNNTEKFLYANIPERFEQFILGDGEKKCVGKADTRTPNSAIFTFAKEDHTLGNLLKHQLMKDSRVLFSGYKVAHPLVPNFELRVQTDGSCTPKEALVSCCRAIVVDLDTLSREFTKEFELRKIVTGDAKD